MRQSIPVLRRAEDRFGLPCTHGRSLSWPSRSVGSPSSGAARSCLRLSRCRGTAS